MVVLARLFPRDCSTVIVPALSVLLFPRAGAVHHVEVLAGGELSRRLYRNEKPQPPPSSHQTRRGQRSSQRVVERSPHTMGVLLQVPVKGRHDSLVKGGRRHLRVRLLRSIRVSPHEKGQGRKQGEKSL